MFVPTKDLPLGSFLKLKKTQLHSAKYLLLLRSYAQGSIYWKYSGEQQKERHLRWL